MANSVWITLSGGGAFSGQQLGPAASNIAAPPFSFLGDLTSGYGSSAIGTLDLVTAGASRFAVNSTAATFANGVIGSLSNNAIALTSTDGLFLQNVTASTAGITVQMSPRFRWRGTAWDTAASETVDFFAEALPATAATPTGTWKLGYSLNGAAATYPFTVSSGGAGTLTGLLTAAGITSTTANPFIFTSYGRLTPAADAQWNFQNNAQNAGIGLDFSTNGLLKVRNTNQNAYIQIDVGGLLNSGIVTISSTAPTISSGFGASPSIVASNGTAAFQINVGTGGTASSGVIGLPAATTGWVVSVVNLTAVAANRADQRTVQTASGTTSATVQNQTISTGAALAWTASDKLWISAVAY